MCPSFTFETNVAHGLSVLALPLGLIVDAVNVFWA